MASTIPAPGTSSLTLPNAVEHSPKRLNAAALIVQGMSITEVARTLKIGRTALHAWKKEPAFVALVVDMQRALLQRTEALYAHGREKAIRRMLDLLDHDNPHVACRAAAFFSSPHDPA